MELDLSTQELSKMLGEDDRFVYKRTKTSRKWDLRGKEEENDREMTEVVTDDDIW